MSYKKALRTNYLCTMKTFYFSLCFLLFSISGFAKTENAIYPYNSIEHTTDILASTDTSSCDCLKDSIIKNTHRLEAYSDKISYKPGETIILYAHTIYSTFSVELIRHGKEDKIIKTIKTVSGMLQDYTNCSFKNGCHWLPSLRFALPTNISSGYYSLRLTSHDTAFYVSFVVRPKKITCKNKILVLASTNSWEAYNDWGGASFYRFYNENTCNLKFASQLSFHRPNYNATPIMDYGAHLTNAELNIVKWLEEKSYHYDVYSDEDLDKCDKISRHYKAVIINTHSEYWTEAMYNHLENYFNKRGKILYLSANGIYWKVTIENDILECRKYGDNHIQTGEKGGRWRNLDRSESKLLGVEFSKPGSGTYAPYEVLEPSHWIFKHTGMMQSQLFGQQSLTCTPSQSGASGHETDRVTVLSPTNIVILAHGTNPTSIDSTDFGKGGADMTYYKKPGAGAVFSVGSISFGGSLMIDSTCSQITENVINKFLHPLRRN
jgi:hypothetical protein